MFVFQIRRAFRREFSSLRCTAIVRMAILISSVQKLSSLSWPFVKVKSKEVLASAVELHHVECYRGLSDSD